MRPIRFNFTLILFPPVYCSKYLPATGMVPKNLNFRCILIYTLLSLKKMMTHTRMCKNFSGNKVCVLINPSKQTPWDQKYQRKMFSINNLIWKLQWKCANLCTKKGVWYIRHQTQMHTYFGHKYIAIHISQHAQRRSTGRTPKSWDVNKDGHSGSTLKGQIP